jgi:tRNA-splicing endonuclease subunit Sen2
MVVPTSQDEEQNKKNCSEWWLASSIGRVVGGVKKTLVYSYVEVPLLSPEFELELLLKTSKVTDIVYRRWLPMRSRD